MKAKTRWILGGLGILTALFVAAALYLLGQLVLIGTAYKAKILCSGVFVAKRDPHAILTTDLLADDLWPMRYFDAKVDHGSPSVTATLWGMAERKAVYRPGLGCVLTHGASEERLRRWAGPDPRAVPAAELGRPWPAGERVVTDPPPAGVDAPRLREAVDGAFSEPDPARLRRTRAVVVVYRGRIIAERYAPGFTPDTPLIGWSMTKSVTNALVGILVREGRLSVDARAPLPEWQGPGDPRRKITLDHLLRMRSGLQFEEDYNNPLKDVIFMVLAVPDMAAYAANKPLQAEPGRKWHYSSGTTNIIARILRGAISGTDADYFAFPRRALFDRVGMRRAIIEPDASGTFVGSSFMYATGRDWARFGLLYLQDGRWGGERILPEGWVQYSRTPTPQAPDGEYGAHFWLEIPAEFRGRREGMSAPGSASGAGLPTDAFHMAGHEGQFVTIIPSRDLVVVRLGLTRLPRAWDHEAFIRRVLEAISA